MSAGEKGLRSAIDRVTAYEREFPRIRLTHAGHHVEVAVPSRICLARATSYFTKEPETIRWIGSIAEGGVLFDIGANIGLYTLWAGITRSAQVVAFEPEAGNYAILNTNLRLNRLTDRCRAYCAGVSDSVGFGSLRIAQDVVGGAGHQVVPQAAAEHTEGQAQGIATTTLDELVYTAGLPCPSHIKIDVDGIEPAIVRGGARLLSDPRVKSVLIELAVKDAEHRAIADHLVELGFVKDEELERAVYAKTAGVKYTGNIIFTRD